MSMTIKRFQIVDKINMGVYSSEIIDDHKINHNISKLVVKYIEELIQKGELDLENYIEGEIVNES